MKTMLLLEDGTEFKGESFGFAGETVGKIIFNTAIVGYQEIITDPTNFGKILCFTYPLIGNYGVNEEFNESERVWVGGLVVKEKASFYSNWQAKLSLEEFLKEKKVVGITCVDTRALTIKIRDDGEMWGIISSEGKSKEELLKRLTDKRKGKESILKEVSVKEIIRFKGKEKRIVVIDLGILKSILRQLHNLGPEVILTPYNTPAKEILKLKPDGVIISNGPEDDIELSKVIDTTKEILGEIPLLGISVGHLIIAQALGARLTKLKVGHRGLNYPIKNKDSFKGEITFQNHSLTIDESSLGEDIKIAERNLNDDSIEKLESEKFKFVSVQYYPLSPGLYEIHPILKEFIEMIKG